MNYERNFHGTSEVAQKLGMGANALKVWLCRHPEYKPTGRFSGDDLLWTPEDIERVKVARAAKAKHGNRRKVEANPA